MHNYLTALMLAMPMIVKGEWYSMSMSPTNCLTSEFQQGGDQQMRNYLTALMMAIGTPMIVMGALTLVFWVSPCTSCATIQFINVSET
jgi:pullulanase/glycogen debranching enzyme